MSAFDRLSSALQYQIVNTLRHFANITVKAIREYDTEDLIE